MSAPYTLSFGEIRLADRPLVGGKNASLGELYQALRPLGVGVVPGFAVTAEAYRCHLAEGRLEGRLSDFLSGLDLNDLAQLHERAHQVRSSILETQLPVAVEEAVARAHAKLLELVGGDCSLAVRSSATAEDLPEASFAGQQETFLNVRGREALLRSVRACFASLFTDRAISYRSRLGINHLQVALSVGVQPMIRADRGASGVIFTLDPDTGFRGAVVVTGAYGLGELVVQGVVTPDEWTVFKGTLGKAASPIIGRRLGTKEVRLVAGDATRPTRSEPVPEQERKRFCLEDGAVLELARWACLIEQHYTQLAGRDCPMDLEWARDGVSGKLYILQARPETVYSRKPHASVLERYTLRAHGARPLVQGQAVGEKVGCGRARVVRGSSGFDAVQPGDVLVAETTNPDWEPVMRRVRAIVTDSGGRTAHAAIVSRELGLPCIVGTGEATRALVTGTEVTVSCAEGATGSVYPGLLPFEVEAVDLSNLRPTRTRLLVNIGDPAQAFKLSFLPQQGVGLARIEFIVASFIGIHPMALARYPQLKDAEAKEAIRARLCGEDPKEYFTRRLSEGVGRIAAAFHPSEVIVRTSDFKTNEYAQLLGGREFEPVEENPMLGFRGASRYDHPAYREGFELECSALLRVRKDLGLKNVKILIPFCRTVEEGKRVLAAMDRAGLSRGTDGLQVYCMCEVPSNAILADEFLEIFDGFSIGSNDLTQLTLGIDRESSTIAPLFDERNEAVKVLISRAIQAARRAGKPIGICGQAPSDFPELAVWLVREGITSLSLNPDALVRTQSSIASIEEQIKSGG